jgi:hypothetical protein
MAGQVYVVPANDERERLLSPAEVENCPQFVEQLRTSASMKWVWSSRAGSDSKNTTSERE